MQPDTTRQVILMFVFHFGSYLPSTASFLMVYSVNDLRSWKGNAKREQILLQFASCPFVSP